MRSYAPWHMRSYAGAHTRLPIHRAHTRRPYACPYAQPAYEVIRVGRMRSYVARRMRSYAGAHTRTPIHHAHTRRPYACPYARRVDGMRAALVAARSAWRRSLPLRALISGRSNCVLHSRTPWKAEGIPKPLDTSRALAAAHGAARIAEWPACSRGSLERPPERVSRRPAPAAHAPPARP